MDDTGLTTVPSAHAVAETIERLAAAAEQHGLRVFARIDFAAGARSVDLQLRPTELVLFGNPRGGTPLMQDRQTAGLDLPIHALAWEDEAGRVWVTYDDMDWLARRHGLGESSASSVAALRDGVATLVAGAAA